MPTTICCRPESTKSISRLVGVTGGATKYAFLSKAKVRPLRNQSPLLHLSLKFGPVPTRQASRRFSFTHTTEGSLQLVFSTDRSLGARLLILQGFDQGIFARDHICAIEALGRLSIRYYFAISRPCGFFLSFGWISPISLANQIFTIPIRLASLPHPGSHLLEAAALGQQVWGATHFLKIARHARLVYEVCLIDRESPPTSLTHNSLLNERGGLPEDLHSKR